MAEIIDSVAHEFSLIWEDYKGQTWSPVNPDARVLVVKGAPKGDIELKGSPKFLARFKESIKGFFGPVTVDVSDDIDGDGDGPDDYNEICSQVSNLYYDLMSAWGIGDEEARSLAVKCAIDNFLECLDKMRSMGDDKAHALKAMIAVAALSVGAEASEKAGKRHSGTDQATIDDARDSHGKMTKALGTVSKHAEAIGAALGKLGSVTPAADDPDAGAKGFVVTEKAEGAVLVEVHGDYGDVVHEFTAESQKGAEVQLADWNVKADKEGKYGDVEYADTKNKKYPIDTEEHAKAAWSYINQEKNASKYDSDELATIKSRIKAACKKFGIEISDDKGSVVPPSTADVVKAVGEAVAAAMATAKGEFETTLTDALAKAKSDSDAAIATVKADAEKKIATATAALNEANELIKAMVGEAKKPTSSGGVPTMNGDGSFTDPTDRDGSANKAAQLKKVEDDTSLSPIARAVKLARIRAGSN